MWKNGIAEILSPTIGTASQVTVSGNDVYVIGAYQLNNNFYLQPATGQYVYWKNGVPNDIDSPGMPISGFLTFFSISVAGNNIYYTTGKAWENGSTKTFTGGSTESTFTNGTDVYFSGTDSVGDLVYWKNDSMHVVQGYFGHGSTRPDGWCLYVSGVDVYMGGIFNTAAYWKNEERTVLYATAAGYDARIFVVTSIFVSGNDVYAAAYRDGLGGKQKIPGYWKNGVEYDLPLDSAADGRPTSIFVSGTDVYVAGYLTYPNSTVPRFSAVYWKNGVETILSSTGVATSIYVAISHH